MIKITTFFSDITTLKIYEKMAMLTQIWHRAKLYFTLIPVAFFTDGIFTFFYAFRQFKMHSSPSLQIRMHVTGYDKFIVNIWNNVDSFQLE